MTNSTQPVTKREWTFVVVLALAALVLSSIPYVVARASTTPEQIYNGLVFDVEDGYSHLAKLQQGVRGSWRYSLLFTSEPHEPVITNRFYIGLGHLSGWLNADPLLSFHAARLVFGFVMLMVIYNFVAHFCSDLAARRLAQFLAVFGSGLGWLLILIAGTMTFRGLTPVDFWLIEMYTFFSLMVFPHFSAAVTLLLLALLGGLRFLETGGWHRALAAACFACGLSVIHPHMLLVVFLIIGLLWAWQSVLQRRLWIERLPGLVFFGLMPTAIAAVQYIELSRNPVMVAWQAQSLTTSPPPVHFGLGYGVLLVLAVPGGWWAWKQAATGKGNTPGVRLLLLPLWLLIVGALLYAPVVFNLQRRLIEGAQVPVAILATAGLRKIVQPAVASSRFAGWVERLAYGRERLAGLAGLVLVAFTLPSTVVLLGHGVILAKSSEKLRFSTTEIAAIDWIETHSAQDAVILSSYDIGGYLPAFTGRRSFMGHWAETVNVETKKELATTFYSDGLSKDFLRTYHIDYVFYGPREKAMGRALDMPPPYLHLVFKQGDVSLFEVGE